MTKHVQAQRPFTVAWALPVWTYPLIGLVSVVIGLLPWLVHGPRLPLQNLWATDVLPQAMPISLLPLSQYYLAVVTAMMAVAGGLAGLIARLAPPARRRAAGNLTAAAVALGLGLASWQSLAVLSAGLGDSEYAGAYFGAVAAWTIIGVLASAAFTLLISRAPRAGATVVVALVAPAAGVWAFRLIYPLQAVTGPATVGRYFLDWGPAVIVGLALAWCGVKTSGRIGAWVMSLALLWLMPALMSGITAMASFRAASSPLDTIGFGMDVFAGALAPREAAPAVILAAIVGLVGSLALWLAGRYQAKGRPAAEEADVVG